MFRPALRVCLLPLLLFSLLPSSALGYVRLNTTPDVPPVPLQRVDNTGIQVYLNNQIVAGVQSTASGKSVTVIAANCDPVAATRAALTTWNSLGTANVSFLALQTTATGHLANDGLMVISIASASDDVSAVGSALAITVNVWTTGSGTDPYSNALTVTNGSIVDSDILLNPGIAFSSDSSTTADLQAVLTHELGHSLGANHTGMQGATMFEAPDISARFLTSDDLAFVNSVYPAAKAPAFGTISGTITASGGTGVPYALLAFTDTAQGISIGGLANPDGTYSVPVPPGSYVVYAEPFNVVVQPGNLYLTTAQAQLVTTFQPTVLGGTANPIPVTVTANATSTASIGVTSGKSALSLPYIGIGGAGKKGDIRTFSGAGAVQVVSGQKIDVAFSGAGFTSAMTDANFSVYGAGITVVPGSFQVDSAVLLGLPVVRVTLTVPTQSGPALASIFVNSGGSSVSLTGELLIVPPTPSFTAPGVVSAASNIVGNGSVSPGEYVSLYGTGVAPSSGPFLGIGYTNTGYIMGFLPQNLGGISVTFDGIPAPVFFTGTVNGTGQINLQVPFEAAGKSSTKVVTSFFGSASPTITLPVVPVHPALFTYPTATSAYAANSADFSTILSTNPAARGSTIVVVGTGMGLPAYSIQTGAAAPLPPAANQNANGWTCTIGGVSAPVLYAAWFAGFAAEAEWYVTVPSSLSVTGAVPIQITSPTGVSTQSNLTVFIK
jgi:uncharacterized protein (TIGR03437 family)